MIKPSVGRVLWVHRLVKNESHLQAALDPKQPEPAFVTYVHGDREVNLAGFTSVGDTFRSLNCSLLQDDDKKPDDRDFACWMPYQVGKAAEDSAKVPQKAADAPPVLQPAAV